MPRNGTGTYTLPPLYNPVVTGTQITTAWANTTLPDLGAEITNSLAADGQKPMSAPLRFTDGTASAPGLTFNAETGTGIFRLNVGQLGITTSGVLALTLTNTNSTFTSTVTAPTFIGALTGNATTASTATLAGNVSGIVAVLNGGTGVTTSTGTGSNVLSGSPAFTGAATAVTAPASDNSATIATTAYVKSQNYSTPAIVGDGVSSIGFRNRLINGDMRVDQRYGGNTVTPPGGYIADRWSVTRGTTAAAVGASTSTAAPVGFTRSLQYNITTAATPAASDFNGFHQVVEGVNFSDLAWGTASAKAVTLSFWFYAGVSTGTFGGAIRNAAGTRSYPFTFAIPTASVWTACSVTLLGDIQGTWAVDNTGSADVFFDMGNGSSLRATAGAWGATNAIGATGTVTPISTVQPIYITGVQLEAGSVATPYERVDFGRQLLLCNRYFWRGLPFLAFNYPAYANGAVMSWPVMFPVRMRVIPTLAISTAGITLGSTGVPTFDAPTQDGGRLLTISTAINGNAGGAFAGNNYLEANAEL